MPTSPQPTELAMPALFTATDDAAKKYQAAFFGWRIGELAALVVGALAGAMPNNALFGLGPIVALLAFLAALVIQASGVGRRAERRWYDARAAAESIKSLSWQYAVAGEAFRRDQTDATGEFTKRLQEVLANVPRLTTGPATIETAGVTDDMAELRAAPQAERLRRYHLDRVKDQVGWYTREAVKNQARATWWSRGIILIEGTAVLVGIARIKGWIEVDVLSVLATLAAGLIAWAQAKNYTTLAESYGVTSHEIALLTGTLHTTTDEDAWAQSVHDAEAAFSREHTMWRARQQSTK